MDVIERVVKTEKEQAILLADSKALFEQKLLDEKASLNAKYGDKKQALLDEHEASVVALEKKIAAKRKRLKNPNYSLSAKQIQTVSKDIVKQLKWELKK